MSRLLSMASKIFKAELERQIPLYEAGSVRGFPCPLYRGCMSDRCQPVGYNSCSHMAVKRVRRIGRSCSSPVCIIRLVIPSGPGLLSGDADFIASFISRRLRGWLYCSGGLDEEGGRGRLRNWRWDSVWSASSSLKGELGWCRRW